MQLLDFTACSTHVCNVRIFQPIFNSQLCHYLSDFPSTTHDVGKAKICDSLCSHFSIFLSSKYLLARLFVLLLSKGGPDTQIRDFKN